MIHRNHADLGMVHKYDEFGQAVRNRIKTALILPKMWTWDRVCIGGTK